MKPTEESLRESWHSSIPVQPDVVRNLEYKELTQTRWVARQLVHEKLFATEVLPVRVLHEASHRPLIAHIVEMLQVVQPHQQPHRQPWPPLPLHIERPKLSFKELPIDRF